MFYETTRLQYLILLVFLGGPDLIRLNIPQVDLALSVLCCVPPYLCCGGTGTKALGVGRVSGILLDIKRLTARVPA